MSLAFRDILKTDFLHVLTSWMIDEVGTPISTLVTDKELVRTTPALLMALVQAQILVAMDVIVTLECDLPWMTPCAGHHIAKAVLHEMPSGDLTAVVPDLIPSMVAMLLLAEK